MFHSDVISSDFVLCNGLDLSSFEFIGHITTDDKDPKNTMKNIEENAPLLSNEGCVSSQKHNRIFNGPLSRSLRLFARTAHSTYSLRSTLLH